MMMIVFIVSFVATVVNCAVINSTIGAPVCKGNYQPCNNSTGVCIVSTGHDDLGFCLPACSHPAFTDCYAKQTALTPIGSGFYVVTSVCDSGACRQVAPAVEANCTAGQVCETPPNDISEFEECTVTLLQGHICSSPSCKANSTCWFSRSRRGKCLAIDKNRLSCEYACDSVDAKEGDRCNGHEIRNGQVGVFMGVCNANKECVDQCPIGGTGPCFLRISSTTKDGVCDSTVGYCAAAACETAGNECIDDRTHKSGKCGTNANGVLVCVTPPLSYADLGDECDLLDENWKIVEGWVVPSAPNGRVCSLKPECVCLGGICTNGICNGTKPMLVLETTTRPVRTTGAITATTTTTTTTVVSQTNVASEMEMTIIGWISIALSISKHVFA
jgi:hypothetical protein